MKLIYNPKIGDFEAEKQPYDSVAIFELLKTMGAKTVSTQRTNKLVIETDKALSAAQKTALKDLLLTFDITKTKELKLTESE